MNGEESLSREVFYLAYHLHWSRDDVLGMPVPERRRYVKMLEEQLKKEAEAIGKPKS